MVQSTKQQSKGLVNRHQGQNTDALEAHSKGVHDEGTEPDDDSLPPDGVDIIHEQDRRQGRPLTPLSKITEERHRRCLELRTAGLTYRAIAEQMGYATHSAAYNACRRARQELKAPDESAPELRSMLYDQMRDAFARIWPLALGGYTIPGTTKVALPSLEHMREARALMAAMAELMGAKAAAPTQHHSVSGGVMVGGAIVHAHGHAVVEAEWDEDRFIAEMRRNTSEGLQEAMAGKVHELKPPSGYIAPRLTESADEDHEVIEANVMENGEAKFDPRKAITFD